MKNIVYARPSETKLTSPLINVLNEQQQLYNQTKISGCTFAPCYIAYTHACGVQNIANEVDAQHLVLTADGIRYTVDARPTGCRFEFQHKGRVSKTIPYDMITDCDIEEPAGSSGPLCCMVKNVLSKVHVDTASSGTVAVGDGKGYPNQHELTLQGLVDPHSFKSKVWEMRRAVKAAGAETKSSNAPSSMRMSRDVGAESLELIKSQNALLRDLLPSPPASAAQRTQEYTTHLWSWEVLLAPCLRAHHETVFPCAHRTHVHPASHESPLHPCR